MSTWAPIFALVSGAANAYSMQMQFIKTVKDASSVPSDKELFKILKGQLWNSFFLYLLSVLYVSTLQYSISFEGIVRYTTLTGSIDRGFLAFGDPQTFLFSDAISLLAISSFITCIIAFLIWRKGGVLKARRNFLILTITACVWLAISPLLHYYLDPTFENDVSTGNYLQGYLLKLIVGPTESTFPNAAFGIFGQVLGIAIALETPLQHIKKYGYTFGIIFLFIAAILIGIDGWSLTPANIGKQLPFQNQILNLGILLIISTWLIGFMEYQTPERRTRIAKDTVIIRRFSFLALTLFLLESVFSISLKKLFFVIFPTVSFSSINVPITLLYLAIILCFWSLVVWLWAKVDFKYSFEWFMVQIVGRLRGRMSNRLNVQESLYNVT